MSAPSWPPEPAGELDLDALLALAHAGGARTWTRAQFHAALDGPATKVLVVRGGPAALSALCVIAQAADEVEIHEVMVHPQARRRGLGRRLLTWALAAAAQAGARAAFLEVREGNHAARALYAALDFVEIARRRGYYRDPDEDALVMRRDLRNLEFSGGAC